MYVLKYLRSTEHDLRQSLRSAQHDVALSLTQASGLPVNRGRRRSRPMSPEAWRMTAAPALVQAEGLVSAHEYGGVEPHFDAHEGYPLGQGLRFKHI